MKQLILITLMFFTSLLSYAGAVHIEPNYCHVWTTCPNGVDISCWARGQRVQPECTSVGRTYVQCIAYDPSGNHVDSQSCDTRQGPSAQQ